MAPHSSTLAWKTPCIWKLSIHEIDYIKLKMPIGILRRRQWHPTPVLLPGKSHGRRSLVGFSPWGRWGSDPTERLPFHFSLSCTGEGNGNPLQCSCLENPRDGGACWAAVSGVAQSRIRLKRLRSSSSIGILILLCFALLHFLDIVLFINWRFVATLHTAILLALFSWQHLLTCVSGSHFRNFSNISKHQQKDYDLLKAQVTSNKVCF